MRRKQENDTAKGFKWNKTLLSAKDGAALASIRPAVFYGTAQVISYDSSH